MIAQSTDDYYDLIKRARTIIDVRSPVEFCRGSVPSALNLPILNDHERELVGTTYRSEGRDAAISLGYDLVDDQVKQQRVEQWVHVDTKHRNSVICCWRGGLRSYIAQQWLAEHGVELPRVNGGSKALRRYCLAVIEQLPQHSLIVLGGRTGVGKTELLGNFKHAIDLEKLAHHRGSAFGELSTPQPTQITFEAAIVAALLQLEEKPNILIEDESKMIGRRNLPLPLVTTMSASPLVVLNATMEERLCNTYENYVVGSQDDQLRSNLQKLTKRLGAKKYEDIHTMMERALKSQLREDHYDWIRLLLKYYYDPMYDYQLSSKRQRVVYEGDQLEVSEYLRRWPSAPVG